MIDEASDPLEGREWIIERRNKISKGDKLYIEEHPLDDPDMTTLRWAMAGRNLSCISIRKSKFEDSIEIINQLYVSIDMTLFRLSQYKDLPIGVGTVPLTKYRLHSNQTSTAWANTGSFGMYKESMLPIQQKFLSDNYTISKIMPEYVRRERYALSLWKRENKVRALEYARPRFTEFGKMLPLIFKYDKRPFLSALWQLLYVISSQIPLFLEFMATSKHLNVEL